MNTLLQRNSNRNLAFPNFWEFDRSLDRIFNNGFGPSNGTLPALDIREKDDEYLIHIDIPGLSADDVDIEVSENVLTVSGERKTETEDESVKCHRVERTYGKFQRSVEVPGGFRHEDVAASFKDGVLEIVLPKPEEEKPRRIKVEAK